VSLAQACEKLGKAFAFHCRLRCIEIDCIYLYCFGLLHIIKFAFAIVGYLRFQVPDYLFQVGDLRVLWPARGYERLLATLLNGPWHSNQRPSARETVIYCPRLWSEQSAINKSHTLWWPGGKQFQAAINGRPQNN